MFKKAIIITIVALLALPALGKPAFKVGAAAPSFSLPDFLTGKVVSLKDDLGKGPIVLTFFTSWSKSCQEETKFLQGLSKKYAKKGLKVIGIAYDRNPKKLKQFLSKNKINFTVLHDKKLKSIKKFRVLIIPTMVLIDKQGKINNLYIDFDKNIETVVEKEVKKLLAPAKK